MSKVTSPSYKCDVDSICSIIVEQSPTPLVAIPADVAAGTGFELLVALANASADRTPAAPELRAALDDVGDTAGETWLNLLGIPLDGGRPYDVARLLDTVERMDGVELRRHLLGRYAWSWCTLAGADTIEAAAAGDRSAGRNLLRHERYYAGQAKASLSTLVRLDPRETRRVIATALEVGARLLSVDEPALTHAADVAGAALADAPASEVIEQVTEGYRYTPEPEAERVLLVPHIEAEPWLVLAQHRAARLIVYRADREQAAEERVAALGKALADRKRVEILSLVTRGVDRVSQLVNQTGLARSTVHHHLAELRAARLVDLEGNARAYRYLPRQEAFQETSALLSEVLPQP